MIRLNRRREPHWVTLANGVRVRCAPFTTAVHLAARREMRQAAAEGYSETEGPLEAKATAGGAEGAAAYISAVAQIVVEEWEGVEDDATDSLAEVTPENVAALMEIPAMSIAFDRHYIAPGMAVESEKNASAPSLNGTSAGAPPIAASAESSKGKPAQSAPTN